MLCEKRPRTRLKVRQVTISYDAHNTVAHVTGFIERLTMLDGVKTLQLSKSLHDTVAL